MRFGRKTLASRTVRKALYYRRNITYNEHGKVIQSGLSAVITCLGNCNECAIRFMCLTTKSKYNSLDLNDWQWENVSKL